MTSSPLIHKDKTYSITGVTLYSGPLAIFWPLSLAIVALNPRK